MSAIIGLLVGTPFCFIAPLVLGSLFWFITLQLYDYYSWNWFFLGGCIILIPLLFRTEIRTAGDFLGFSASTWSVDDDGLITWLNVGATFGGTHGMAAAGLVADPRRATAGVMEMFLFGPRLALSGSRHIVGAMKVHIRRYDEAAEVVAILLDHETGLPTKTLASRFEDDLELAKTLRWLTFYEWIGVGENGAKVFLFSEERGLLQRTVGR